VQRNSLKLKAATLKCYNLGGEFFLDSKYESICVDIKTIFFIIELSFENINLIENC